MSQGRPRVPLNVRYLPRPFGSLSRKDDFLAGVRIVADLEQVLNQPDYMIVWDGKHWHQDWDLVSGLFPEKGVVGHKWDFDPERDMSFIPNKDGRVQLEKLDNKLAPLTCNFGFKRTDHKKWLWMIASLPCGWELLGTAEETLNIVGYTYMLCTEAQTVPPLCGACDPQSSK